MAPKRQQKSCTTFIHTSEHLHNLTGVNGAPDNMTQHQEKWLQKEGLPQKAMDSALESK